MVKVCILFHSIQDEEAFLEMYLKEMLSKFLNIPGVMKVETSKIYSDINPYIQTDEKTYKFSVEIYFPTMEAINEAIDTPEGKEAIEAYVRDFGENSTLYAAEEYVHYKDTKTLFGLS